MFITFFCCYCSANEVIAATQVERTDNKVLKILKGESAFCIVCVCTFAFFCFRMQNRVHHLSTKTEYIFKVFRKS